MSESEISAGLKKKMIDEFSTGVASAFKKKSD